MVTNCFWRACFRDKKREVGVSIKIVLDSSDILELKENKNKQIDIVHKS